MTMDMDMNCTNCQRLSHDLKTLTIALKNIKKWIHEKLEIEIPRCLDYPDLGLGLGHKKRLKNHNLIAACLKNRAVVRLKRLYLPPDTYTNTTQNQGSVSLSSTGTAEDYNKYDNDIVNNDDQNLESRSAEASTRSSVIPSKSGGDGSLPITIILPRYKKGLNSRLIEDNCIDEPCQKIKKTPLKGKIKVLCPKCGKLFYNEASLDHHILYTHQVEKECRHCHKKYTRFELKNHIRLMHPKSLQCPFCATMYKNEYSLKNHLRTFHNKDRPKYKCSFTNCNREFYYEYQLKYHSKSHSEDINVSKPFKCTVEECDKRFARMRDLKSHIKGKGFHKGQEKESFVCQNIIETNGVREKCSESFSARLDLKRLNYLVHNQQYEFKCTFDGCFQSYKEERLLKNHLKFHEKTKNVNEKVVGMDVFRECPICLKQLNVSRNIVNFNNHIKFVHEGKRPTYPCSFENCKISYYNKISLGLHVKKQHPDHFKPEDYPALKYSCSECDRKFNTNSKLTQHKTTHLKVGTFSCNVCDLKFKNKRNVPLHIQAVHSGLKPFACNYENCDKTFALKYYLKLHISVVHLGKTRKKSFTYKRKPKLKKKDQINKKTRFVHRSKIYSCNFENCKVSFSCHTYLKFHKYSVHNQQFEYKCTFDGCFQSFTQKERMVKHLEFHEKKIYSCSFENCGISFSHHYDLKVHNYSVHSIQLYEFKCTFDGCFQSYKGKFQLVKHLKFHEKTNEKTKIIKEKVIFKECPICLKQINVSTNSSNFNGHMRNVHEGKRPYPCSFENCEKSFKSKSVFGVHVKRHHPDHFQPQDYPAPKEYLCSECGKQFHECSTFINHKTTHLKVGTFSCNFCDLKFRRKPFVKYHVQAVHSGLRPFACNYENCDKTFALKYYLTSHISQVHLGISRSRAKRK